MCNTDPTNTQRVNPVAREGYAVPVSYKVPIMLLIVKSGKVLSVTEERQNAIKGVIFIAILETDNL